MTYFSYFIRYCKAIFILLYNPFPYDYLLPIFQGNVFHADASDFLSIQMI